MKLSLWEEAAKTVEPKWQDQLNALTDLSCGPDQLLEDVLEKQKLCRSRGWKCCKPNGQKVYVRDILEKVAFCLGKVQQIGDVAVQYDPVHAALPWAGARFLLMVQLLLSPTLQYLIAKSPGRQPRATSTIMAPCLNPSRLLLAISPVIP
jgi:hypothetical protein